MPEQLKTFLFLFKKTKSVIAVVPVNSDNFFEIALSAAFNIRLEDRLDDEPDFCAEIVEPNTLKNFISLDEVFLEKYKEYLSSRMEEMTLPFEDELCISCDVER